METYSPRGQITGPIIPTFILKLRISLGAKILYSILCNFCGDKDHCWPSHAKMADEVGCSVSSVKSYLKELQKEKLIGIRAEKVPYRSSTYFMLRPTGFVASRPTVSTGANSDYPQTNSGYRNNFKKKEKENTPPFPPASASVSPPTRQTASPRQGRGDFLSVNRIFERFWAAYPKKEAKELARTVWHRLWRQGLLPDLEVMLKALERFRASAQWLKEHGRFVPQLVNWLKGQRWLDELSDAGASLAPEEKARQDQARQVMAHIEKQEQARQAEYEDETARLRPDFEDFLSRFSDGSTMRGPAWGLWSLLHRKGKAPKACDVPSGYERSVLDFLRGKGLCYV